MSQIDGLVLGGGADVAPELYGAEPLLESARRHVHSQRAWYEVGIGLLITALRRAFSPRCSPHATARAMSWRASS